MKIRDGPSYVDDDFNWSPRGVFKFCSSTLSLLILTAFGGVLGRHFRTPLPKEHISFTVSQLQYCSYSTTIVHRDFRALIALESLFNENRAHVSRANVNLSDQWCNVARILRVYSKNNNEMNRSWVVCSIKFSLRINRCMGWIGSLRRISTLVATQLRSINFNRYSWVISEKS